MPNPPIRFRRQIMALTVQPHVRGIHRRMTITDAQAQGIDHFRLEVPRWRLTRLRPDGWIGRQLWRVRTLREWVELVAQRNRENQVTSDFTGIGAHHGDYTYVVPVPEIYLEEAVAHGQMLRRRHGLDAPQQRQREAS